MKVFLKAKEINSKVKADWDWILITKLDDIFQLHQSSDLYLNIVMRTGIDL